MRKLLFLFALVNMVGCSKCNESRPMGSVKLCNTVEGNKCPCGLFLEVYSNFSQGAWGAGVNSKYITDSVNFRVYIGTYDEENEWLIPSCNGGDSIYVEKRLDHGRKDGKDSMEIEERSAYSISDLKKQHVME